MKKEYSDVVFRVFPEQKTLAMSIRNTYPGCSVKPFVSEFTSTFIEIIGKNLSNNSCARLIGFIHNFKPQVTIYVDNMEIEEIEELEEKLKGLDNITYQSKNETIIVSPKEQNSSPNFFQPPSPIELNFYNIVKFLSEDNFSSYISEFCNTSYGELETLKLKLEQYTSRFKKADTVILPEHFNRNFRTIENFFSELNGYLNNQHAISLN